MFMPQTKMAKGDKRLQAFLLQAPFTWSEPSRVRRSLKITRPAVVSVSGQPFAGRGITSPCVVLGVQIDKIAAPAKFYLGLCFDHAPTSSKVKHVVYRLKTFVLALHLVAPGSGGNGPRHNVL